MFLCKYLHFVSRIVTHILCNFLIDDNKTKIEQFFEIKYVEVEKNPHFTKNSTPQINPVIRYKNHLYDLPGFGCP